MANIQLNIDVNDEQFKQLCISNINDLPKDKLQEILLKAVELTLIRDKENPTYSQDTNILVKTVKDGYHNKTVPTEFMKQILNKIDVDKYLGPVAEEVATYIKENYVNLVREYMVEAFCSMLFSDRDRYSIKALIDKAINQEFNK